MKIRFRSFQTKVTLAFILSLLFMAVLGNFLLYEYSLNSQFNQIKDKLLAISSTSAIAIDADLLLKVPLNREGVNSEAYKIIAAKLKEIKRVNPSLKYIYTMRETDKPGIWQFIVDPDPVLAKKDPNGPTAFPGDEYDVSRFPEMLEALQQAGAGVSEHWDDATYRSFQEEYLLPLEPVVKRTLDAIKRLAEELRKAERECSPA